jgi:hypothetical protein
VTTRTYLDFIGRDKTQRAFASVSKSVSGIEKKFGLAKAAVGLFGLAAAGGLAASAKETIDYADRVGKLADRMGSSAEALSQLEFVAERSGVGFESLTKSMEKSSNLAAEAAAKGGASAAVFEELGISAGKLAKLSPEAQLLALADAFNDVESPADRTRLAMDLWGRSGAEMLQITQAGSGGITELMEQADALGRTLTTETAKGAADANDGLTNLASVGRAFNLSLARYLGPTIGKVAQALGEWIPKAVFAASKRIVELRATVLGVIGKIVGGLSKVYGVLGKLPGWLGESYRDAEASAKKFAAEMTDLGELYRVEAEGMVFETREFSAAIQDADEVAGVHIATVRALAGGTKAAAAAQREKVEATKASTVASQAATKAEAELVRQQEQWTQAVKRVEEETRTPHEVYKARIEELIELQAHGLGNEAFARAVVQAQEGIAVALVDLEHARDEIERRVEVALVRTQPQQRLEAIDLGAGVELGGLAGIGIRSALQQALDLGRERQLLVELEDRRQRVFGPLGQRTLEPGLEPGQERRRLGHEALMCLAHVGEHLSAARTFEHQHAGVAAALVRERQVAAAQIRRACDRLVDPITDEWRAELELSQRRFVRQILEPIVRARAAARDVLEVVTILVRQLDPGASLERIDGLGRQRIVEQPVVPGRAEHRALDIDLPQLPHAIADAP